MILFNLPTTTTNNIYCFSTAHKLSSSIANNIVCVICDVLFDVFSLVINVIRLCASKARRPYCLSSDFHTNKHLNELYLIES